MKQKVRFFIADILNDIFPASCWTALASWALGYRGFKDVPLIKNQCDIFDDGRCYCGKQYNKAMQADADRWLARRKETG